MSSVISSQNQNNRRLKPADLTKEKIQRLLMAMRTGPLEDITPMETTEYNWNRPHRYNRIQLKKLDDFIRKAASAGSKRLGELCNNGLQVKVSSSTQHFAEELLEQLIGAGHNNYYLAFGNEKNNWCGFVIVPTQSAVVLVKMILADTESEQDSSRELSQLEESLLLDLSSTFIEALCTAHPDCHFVAAEKIVRGRLPLELADTDELYRIIFDIGKVTQENAEPLGQVSILMFCDKLEPVAGKAPQAENKTSQADVAKAIVEHLQQMSVVVTAQLGSTILTFEQLMDLQVNDIVMLDQKVDEPIKLIGEGQTIMLGLPAKSAGKYAVVLTEMCRNTSFETESSELLCGAASD